MDAWLNNGAWGRGGVVRTSIVNDNEGVSKGDPWWRDGDICDAGVTNNGNINNGNETNATSDCQVLNLDEDWAPWDTPQANNNAAVNEVGSIGLGNKN